jgi:hypothetical protein
VVTTVLRDLMAVDLMKVVGLLSRRVEILESIVAVVVGI